MNDAGHQAEAVARLVSHSRLKEAGMKGIDRAGPTLDNGLNRAQRGPSPILEGSPSSPGADNYTA
jgi:hypothetical protein